MIKMNLLENGTDSLKSAYDKMQKLNELEEGLDHYLKDIVFFLNHGIEILFKLILKNKGEELIFSNIKKYNIAKEEQIRMEKDNVFQVNPNLKTVSLMEAIEKCKKNEFEISYEYENSLIYLNKMRNQFMHYEIEISDEEMLRLLIKLQLVYGLSLEFFSKYINNLNEHIDNARFEVEIDDHGDILAELQKEADYERYLEEMMDLE
ncbi:BAR domain-containing protein [Paenibacillus sp. ALE1]